MNILNTVLRYRISNIAQAYLRAAGCSLVGGRGGGYEEKQCVVCKEHSHQHTRDKKVLSKIKRRQPLNLYNICNKHGKNGCLELGAFRKIRAVGMHDDQNSILKRHSVDKGLHIPTM